MLPGKISLIFGGGFLRPLTAWKPLWSLYPSGQGPQSRRWPEQSSSWPVSWGPPSHRTCCRTPCWSESACLCAGQTPTQRYRFFYRKLFAIEILLRKILTHITVSFFIKDYLHTVLGYHKSALIFLSVAGECVTLCTNHASGVLRYSAIFFRLLPGSREVLLKGSSVRCTHEEYRGCIQREMLVMETYAGVDSGVQHSIPVMTNANVFSSNYSEME